ncbi:uncharacterized protein TNCV_4401311 [Trichonephila clavipes]|nr:uncharacterized protein TNCV_4401311 [Trichonephila clavipes]
MESSDHASFPLTSFGRQSNEEATSVSFPCARHNSNRRRWVSVKGGKRNGRCDPKCPSARCLCMVQENTVTPNEGATIDCMAADEAFGCTRAFLTMWRSSRRRRPEPGLRVNDISRIPLSQHLLTMQSELPN